MKLYKKTRVLLLERNPRTMVELLAFFEARPDIEVVEANEDVRAFMAETAYMERRALMDALHPDVIVVDLRAPLADELIWIARMQALAFAPLIAFTACDMATSRAFGIRFFAVVRRPLQGDPDSTLSAFRKLAFAVRRAARGDKTPALTPPEAAPGRVCDAVALIAIGASAGGTEAILSILGMLPGDMPPILVVQHITKGFSEVFAAHIHRTSRLDAAVARDGEPALAGHVYVAPDAAHMTVEKRGDAYFLKCAEGPRVSGHLPAIDALFTSVAGEAGDKAVGVLLTGMGKDGAEGLLLMRRAGALTIGQDERTSLIYGMPRVAYEMGAVARQLPLDRIGGELVKQTHKGES